MPFSVSNGPILDPAGKPWLAAGFGVYDPTVAQQILTLFPGINFIRLPDDAMHPPAYWAAFIGVMTAAKVVCEIEFHPWPMIAEPPPGAYAGWVANVASYYKANPYVWGGSMNEPQGGDISSEHTAFYNAWRGAGNANPVMLVGGVGGGNPGATGRAVLRPAAYAAMQNIVWDLHCYGWTSNQSTDQTVVNAALAGNATDSGILSLKSIPSASGVIPVIVGEFGPSTDGQTNDPNGDQVIMAVTDWAVKSGMTSGFAGWAWASDAANGLQSGGSLTAWGRQLAAAIKATTGTQGVIPPVAAQSPDNTVIMAGSTDAITDAGGNAWTITAAGQVAVNGVPDTTTNGVTWLCYVGGTVWQKNATLWWGKSSPAAAWSPPTGTATSPMPVVVVPPPASGPTHLTVGAQIDDAQAMLDAAKVDLGTLKP